MFFISDWYVLPIALLLDFIIGDREFLPHPVRYLGKAVDFFEPVFRKKVKDDMVAGLLFAVFLIVGVFFISSLFLNLMSIVHPVIAGVFEIIALYYCISVKSLRDAAMDVVTSYRQGGLGAAREKLAKIVGRDVAVLDSDGVAKATVETVAENYVDGVVSPLFWAGIGGAPFAVMYKMINTLDSMVGYKNEKYEFFGKASARFDDIANFIPARLSVFLIAGTQYLLTREYKSVLETAGKDGLNHTSPNAGYPEAAFAGALGVRLGGSSRYNGILIEKPIIGGGFGKPAFNDIELACRLLQYASIGALILAMTIAHLVSMVV